MKSSFSITEIKDDRVIILDNNMGGKSVTNDAENVVEYLYNIYGNRRIFDIDPRQYPNTWGSGASPGLRFAWPFGVIGSGVSKNTQP
jgi:hypothetical protein